MRSKFIVITTIHGKTDAIRSFEKKDGWHIVLVGDQKTPSINSSRNLTFLSVNDQEKLGYDFIKYCPYNHYARKNIGYLYAIQQGAEIIYDTDDDNWPTENWGLDNFSCERQYVTTQKFVNIYRHFTDNFIWPRGYPLDEIHNQSENRVITRDIASIGVWQGLVDLEPDVDAIYRLVIKESIRFARNKPIFLGENVYCPFNSQNTYWHKDAFPYLYLPAMTSFRFTDILRGYIAQKLMWSQNLYLGFYPADVYQKRNSHNLLTDFRQEIESYLNVKPIVNIINELQLKNSPIENLKKAYSSLVSAGFCIDSEIILCQAWLNDLTRILNQFN